MDGNVDDEDELAARGVDLDRGAGITDDAERDGPSFEATIAARSIKRLYSYLAGTLR